MTMDLPRLRQELVSRIRVRTGGQLRNLDIQLSAAGVVLHGSARSFYVKQLAQHGVLDVLPDIELQNHIVVS